MEKVAVSDVMTQSPIVIRSDKNLLDCSRVMVRKRVGSLLIVEKKKLLGIICERDILWAIVKKSKDSLKDIKAIDISPRKIITIKPTATIKEAISKFKKYKVDRLPVVKEGELVGYITIKDVLNFHPELYPELEEFRKIREESRKMKMIQRAMKEEDGVCEMCGKEGNVYEFNGMYICAGCRD